MAILFELVVNFGANEQGAEVATEFLAFTYAERHPDLA
jgi:hypothetical protein